MLWISKQRFRSGPPKKVVDLAQNALPVLNCQSNRWECDGYFSRTGEIRWILLDQNGQQNSGWVFRPGRFERKKGLVLGPLLSPANDRRGAALDRFGGAGFPNISLTRRSVPLGPELLTIGVFIGTASGRCPYCPRGNTASSRREQSTTADSSLIRHGQRCNASHARTW